MLPITTAPCSEQNPTPSRSHSWQKKNGSRGESKKLKGGGNQKKEKRVRAAGQHCLCDLHQGRKREITWVASGHHVLQILPLVGHRQHHDMQLVHFEV